jgi:hypothetical protein
LIHGQTISSNEESVVSDEFKFKSPQRFFAPSILDICKINNIPISTISKNIKANKLVIFEPFWAAYPATTESGFKISTIEIGEFSNLLTLDTKRKFEALIKSNLNQLFPNVPVVWHP